MSSQKLKFWIFFISSISSMGWLAGCSVNGNILSNLQKQQLDTQTVATATGFNSGGALVSTNGSYSVNSSIGQAPASVQMQTSGGYTVYSNVQGITY